MVEKVEFEGEDCFRCEECGFHYWDRKDAEKCEKHCLEHSSCNSEVAKRALEMN